MKELLRQLMSKEISLIQAIHAVTHFLSPSRAVSGDDFNWSRYHLHYQEELASISTKSQLDLGQGDFKLLNGRLVLEEKVNLLASHHTLYEAIAQFEFKTILEVGCGGGDHLSNLSRIFPTASFKGIDISQEQLDFALRRHPQLRGGTFVQDISRPISATWLKSDIVYSHAVLMHISEKNGRFQTALRQMLELANVGVVLVENWTQHDFLSAAKELTEELESWQGARIGYHESSKFPGVLAMVITKGAIFNLVESYEEFLQGASLRIH
jgi:ubiquinone/menaquinone biosynthesis C-methylase UbiE